MKIQPVRIYDFCTENNDKNGDFVRRNNINRIKTNPKRTITY